MLGASWRTLRCRPSFLNVLGKWLVSWLLFARASQPAPPKLAYPHYACGCGNSDVCECVRMHV